MNIKKRLKSLVNVLRGWNKPPMPPSAVNDSAPLIHSPLVASFPVMDNALLSGKNVFITGAGRNIGRSIALEMAQQGANVFFTDIDDERRARLEEEVDGMGFRGKGFLSDIRKREDIDSLVEFFAENAIGIDILVNNVGVETGAIGFSTIEPEQWQETFATNVFGPMYLTKRISQRMIDKSVPGSIIFITSIHQFTIRRLPDYSASKAALGMIVKELALDLAPCGIRVNGIAPGWVKEDEKGNTYGARYAPLHGSSINPCYIGRAAVFLASEHFSRFTTGAVLTIDGGLSLYNYLVDDSCHDK